MIIANNTNQQAYLASNSCHISPKYGEIIETEGGYEMYIQVTVKVTNVADILLQKEENMIVPYIRNAVGRIEVTDSQLALTIRAYSSFGFFGGYSVRQAAINELKLAKQEKDWCFAARLMLKDYLLAQINRNNANPIAAKVAKTLQRLERAKQLVTI
ncbi:hypothetical protein [Motilimonas eburnea]|uniref:hypothetical protein n=1 Tax=Motilimonas eburnea TaxID=1737488 RepID=UPI001E3B9D4E|nr:hypothetical protein [Motilimonas eburnea]MCE2571683.1 hypothetical protein [Motilimonas eburnea]